MKSNSKLQIVSNGIFAQNPTFRLVLGMCPTLAITTSAFNGLGMGLAATLILICSNALVSLLRKVIPDKVRIPAYVLIIATFVTLLEMILKKFIPTLYSALGIYLPLIVVNCIILARAEAFASSNKVGDSILDGLGMGLGFTLALTCLGFVRELIGSGTIFAGSLGSLTFGISLGAARDYSLAIFVLPAGGFLTLGLAMALVNLVSDQRAKKKQLEAEKAAQNIENAKSALEQKEGEADDGILFAYNRSDVRQQLRPQSVSRYMPVPRRFQKDGHGSRNGTCGHLRYGRCERHNLVRAKSTRCARRGVFANHCVYSRYRALVQLIEMVLKKYMPALYSALGVYLPLITTNCAVLGVAILNIDTYGVASGISLLQAFLNGTFSGVGFLIAIMLLAGVREKMDLDAVPKPFRGFPITLISASILSMAFVAFGGLISTSGAVTLMFP